MSDNSIRFTATGAGVAQADTAVTLEGLPDDNAGIRIDSGRGHIRFGGKATAFNFDVDVRQSIGRAFKLPKGTTWFAICGGPANYSVGTAEWVS